MLFQSIDKIRNNIDYKYIDNAKTATNPNRDRLHTKLSDSKKGEFDSVIVRGINRFKRIQINLAKRTYCRSSAWQYAFCL